MTTTTRTLYAALVEEPLSIAIDQPHQIAISTMSVALMAGFAARAGIVDQYVAVVLAIGIEWAWLRGVASDASSPTQWGVALNISAFVLAGLWGVLFAAELLNAFNPQSWGWWLAIIHVVPVVWLSLCSAMCHRTKLIAERHASKTQQAEAADEAKRMREAVNALHIKEAEERLKIELWKDAQTFKAQLRMQDTNAVSKNARSRFTGGSDAYQCASCGADLTMKQYAASKRWGHCAKCK